MEELLEKLKTILIDEHGYPSMRAENIVEDNRHLVMEMGPSTLPATVAEEIAKRDNHECDMNCRFGDE